MFKTLSALLLISFFSLLAGCGAGRDFVRPSPETFKLGQTTYLQVVEQLGDPKKTGDVLKNGQTVKSITYVYAHSMGEPAESGVIPARALSYYFYDGKLVGEEFVSSFKSDSSNFDDTKIGTITKGKTTRAEAVQLLGRPSATYIPPMVKKTSGEAIGYIYSTTRGGAFTGFKFFRKVLIISFDDRSQVSDIDYESSGTQ